MRNDRLKAAAQELKARLAALDFTDENAAIATAEERIAELDAAHARGREKMRALEREITAIKRADGPEIAEALMADASNGALDDLAPSIETLQNRRDALRRGLSDLTAKSEEARYQLRSARAEALRKAADAAAGMRKALETMRKESAESFAEAQAALAMLENLFGHARDAVGPGVKPVAALTEYGGILGARRPDTLQVPREVIDALSAIEGKSPAIHAATGDSVTIERPPALFG